MTLAQERDVWTEYQHATGEERARLEDELVREHWKLSHMVAHKYSRQGKDYDEIHSHAVLGLLKAVRGFQSGKGYKFSTYAVTAMHNQIRMAHRDNKRNIVAYESLDQTVFDGGSETLEAFLEDKDIPTSDEPLIIGDFRDAIIKAVGKMSENEKTVFTMRIANDITQADVAKAIGVSQAAISRIDKRARLKIHRELVEQKLIPDEQMKNKIGAFPAEIIKLAEDNGIPYDTFKQRVRRGMTMEEAATKPITTFFEEARKFIVEGINKGMTSRQIRDNFFPDRSFHTIQTYTRNVRKQLKEEGLL